jgi:hypothetical protein
VLPHAVEIDAVVGRHDRTVNRQPPPGRVQAYICRSARSRSSSFSRWVMELSQEITTSKCRW